MSRLRCRARVTSRMRATESELAEITPISFFDVQIITFCFIVTLRYALIRRFVGPFLPGSSRNNPRIRSELQTTLSSRSLDHHLRAIFRRSRLSRVHEKRVSRNIRNIRGRIVGRHPVDYFENIITKREARSSPQGKGEACRGEDIAENAKEERRRKRDRKERAFGWR